MIVALIQMKYRRPKSSAKIFSRMYESSMKSSRTALPHSVATVPRAPDMVVNVAMEIVHQTGPTLTVVATEDIPTQQLPIQAVS